MNWNDLKSFIAVSETGNVSLAAARQEISAATMTRHIDRLEDALDLRLFHRRQTGYAITEAGESLLPIARKIAANVDFLERRATPLSSNPIANIRMELPEVLGAYIIVPGLASLGAWNSFSRLEVTNSAASAELSERKSDIVVRLKQPEFGGYTVRRIGQLSRAIYCSQSYLDRMGLKAEDARLDQVDLVGWSDPMKYLSTASWFREVTGGRPLTFRASNVRLQIDAVISGMGASALPKFVADAHGLVRLGEGPATQTESHIWLLRSTETEQLGDVDLILGWIEESVTRNRKALIFSEP